MARTPVVLQMEAAECGAASLTMVLGHHGQHVTLEQVRASCGTSRDGVTVAQIVTAAKAHGLATKVVMRDIEALPDLPFPLILHWSFDHFVVLEAIKGKKFVILDPAVGRRIVDRAEFGANYTGLAIATAPDEGFTKTRPRQSTIKLLLREAVHSPDAVIGTGVLSLAAIVPGIVLSGAIGVFVDHVVMNDRRGWVVGIIALLAFAAVALAVSGWLRSRIEAALRTKIGIKIGAQGFWHALHLPLSYFGLRSAGEVSSRLRLGSEVGGTVAGPLSELVPNVLMVLCYLGIIALYSPSIALAVAAISGLNLVILAALASKIAEANRAYQMADGRASGAAISGLVAHSTYRLLGREELLVSRLAAAEDRALDAEQQLGRLRVVGQTGPAISSLAINAFVIAMGAIMVMRGELTLGGIVAVQLIAGLLAGPVAALAGSLTQLQEASGALMRVGDLMENAVDPGFSAHSPAIHPENRAGVLSLRNVTFGFKTSEPIFSNVDFDLQPGRFVALLGPSGTGKSSLAKICAGLAAPQSGQVLLDGVPLSHWDQAALRSELQYVPQSSAVFSGSLEDNITLWNGEMGNEAMTRAIQWAGMSPVIGKKRNGILTQIAGADAELSGGEAQRLALARALARNPKILILDETTSALDPRTEADILQSLRASGAGVLLITHRRRTALMCDEAILMGQGRLLMRDEPSRVLSAFETLSTSTIPERMSA